MTIFFFHFNLKKSSLELMGETQGIKLREIPLKKQGWIATGFLPTFSRGFVVLVAASLWWGGS